MTALKDIKKVEKNKLKINKELLEEFLILCMSIVIVFLGIIFVYSQSQYILKCNCIGGWNSSENITFKIPQDFCVQKGYEGGYFGSSTDLQKPLITCYKRNKEGWTKYDTFEFGDLVIK
jgi:hypothetical protein